MSEETKVQDDALEVTDLELLPMRFGERSEQIDKVLGALVKAHANGLANVSKDATNPHFKSRYATLAACVDAIGPVLNKAGLVVFQLVTGPGKVKTILAHTSGQYIAGEVELPPIKDDPQAAGSAITYARRYALPAIVGVATDDDDDGNRASEGKSEVQTSAEPSEAEKAVAFAKAINKTSAKFDKLLAENGFDNPTSETQLRLTNLMRGMGFDWMLSIKTSEDRHAVNNKWVETLAVATEFYKKGGAK